MNFPLWGHPRRSDASGSIDLTKDFCQGGHYRGVMPMGLFNNLSLHRQKIKHHRFSKQDVTEPLNVIIFDFIYKIFRFCKILLFELSFLSSRCRFTSLPLDPIFLSLEQKRWISVLNVQLLTLATFRAVTVAGFQLGTAKLEACFICRPVRLCYW